MPNIKKPEHRKTFLLIAALMIGGQVEVGRKTYVMNQHFEILELVRAGGVNKGDLYTSITSCIEDIPSIASKMTHAQEVELIGRVSLQMQRFKNWEKMRERIEPGARITLFQIGSAPLRGKIVSIHRNQQSVIVDIDSDDGPNHEFEFAELIQMNFVVSDEDGQIEWVPSTQIAMVRL